MLLIAMLLGIASALLAFKFHSLFYCLIPIWAFALGYFTSWRWGLLAGFLLFTGYETMLPNDSWREGAAWFQMCTWR